ADRNRSHWSTSKTPSYTKSVSWQHHHIFDSTMLLLSNNPSDELILHLEKKYELVDDNGMKVEILGLIKMIKMHL
ncbi:hypothetical protein, partial [Escherichia fergusonii]|uniref:hypothetical protein n=1 Tax=Escherichia fergusonii TaxID=564 RepID=UPI001F2E9E61